MGIDRAGINVQLPQRSRDGIDDLGVGAGVAGVAYAVADTGLAGRAHFTHSQVIIE